MLLSIFIAFVFSLSIVKTNASCMHGWKLSDDGQSCVINCGDPRESHGSLHWNVYCQSAPTNRYHITHNEMDNTLTMDIGQSLASSKSTLPLCYNVTLRENQYNVTIDGILKIGEYYFPPASNVSGESSFCYPLSPQLLQCEIEKTLVDDYYIENGVNIVIPSKNIKAYLGDFYITDNGTALTCSRGVIRTLYESPRCNYVVVYSDDYVIKEDGSMYIYTADFTIKNPAYSVVFGQTTSVCFPLSLDYLDCPSNYSKTLNYLFNRDMSASVYNTFFTAKPNEYIVENDEWLVICEKTPTSKYNSASILIYLAFSICLFATAIILLTIVILLLNFKTLITNNHLLSMFFHITFLFFIYITFLITTFHYTKHGKWSCYLLFSINYFSNISMMSWLNVVVFDLWQTFARLPTAHKKSCIIDCQAFDNNSKSQIIIYSSYAFGVALLLTIITLVIDLSPNLCQITFGICPHISRICWFNNVEAFDVYYAAPYTMMTMLNLISLFLTIRAIRRASNETELVNPKWRTQMKRITVKLFVLSGFCYIVILVCFIVDAIDTAYFMYSTLIYDGIMIGQGIAIFLIYYKKILLENIVKIRSLKKNLKM